MVSMLQMQTATFLAITRDTVGQIHARGISEMHKCDELP